MKKESKTFGLNENRHEIALLHELSGDISNFKKGFSSKLRYTFILGPWSSSMFGFEVEDNEGYLGVPGHLFSMISKNNIYVLNYIEGKPGIFLVIYSGSDVDNGRPIAIRIFMREKRVKALSKFKKVTLIRMNKDGTAEEGYSEDEFEVQVKEVKGLDWEHFGKKRDKK